MSARTRKSKYLTSNALYTMAKEKGTPKLQQTNGLVHQKKLSKIVAELVHQKKPTKIAADYCTGLLYKAKIAADNHVHREKSSQLKPLCARRAS